MKPISLSPTIDLAADAAERRAAARRFGHLRNLLCAAESNERECARMARYTFRDEARAAEHERLAAIYARMFEGAKAEHLRALGEGA